MASLRSLDPAVAPSATADSSYDALSWRQLQPAGSVSRVKEALTLRLMAETPRYLGGGGQDFRGKPRERVLGHATRRSGDAHAGDHAAAEAKDRRSHAAKAGEDFLVVERPPPGTNTTKVRSKRIAVGDGAGCARMKSDSLQVRLEPLWFKMRQDGLPDSGAVGRTASPRERWKAQRMRALHPQDVDNFSVFEDAEAGALAGFRDERIQKGRRALANIKARDRRHAEFEESKAKAIPTRQFIDGDESVPAQRLQQSERRALMKAGGREVGKSLFNRSGGENLQEKDRAIQQSAGVGLGRALAL